MSSVFIHGWWHLLRSSREAAITITGGSSRLEWASGLPVTGRSEQVFTSWSSWQWGGGTHTCLPCKATPRSSTLLSCSGTSKTQTAPEPVLGDGGWESNTCHEPSLWCRWLSFCAWQSSCYIGAACSWLLAGLQKTSLQKDKGGSESTSLLRETSIWTRLRPSLKPELFRSEVFL